MFMRLFVRKSIRFLREEDGPTAVEYAVMLALIIAVCVTAIAAMGQRVNGVFSNATLTNALP